MPVFRYQCGKCERTGDYLLRPGAEPENCMYCGHGSLIKVWMGQVFSSKDGTKFKDIQQHGGLEPDIEIVGLGMSMIIDIEPESDIYN